MINNTIDALKKARNDIRDSIINKGGSLTPTSRFDTYADAIRGIQGAVDIKFPNSFLYLLKEGDPDLYPYSSSYYRYRGVQTKIYLDDSITDVRRMFGNTMVDCVFLPNGHRVTDMFYMFRNSQATTLDLSNFDTSGVTNMTSMFQDSKATALDLSSFDTSGVTRMYYMFGDSKATALDLSSFDTSKVTDMSEMFRNSQATTLDLSNFDTSKVTDMEKMFQSSQATSLDLSSFDTSGVKNMSSMFQSSQATTLDLSNFDTSGVTSMSSMFRISMVKTVYCRTEADRTRFMGSGNLPVGVTFIVGAP